MNTTRTIRNRTASLATLVAVVALAACSGDPAPISAPDAASVTSTSSAASPPETTTRVPPAGAAVKISQTALGDVLADPSGQTLYAFTNDVDAKSTCYGTCAEAWPPVIVPDDFVISPGLDSGIFANTQRDDGQRQLVAGKYPLYLYAADAKPGDVTGQGSADVWYAVDTSGRLIEDATPTDHDSGGGYGESGAPTSVETAPTPANAAAPTVGLADSAFGSILTDSEGMTLYVFTADDAGVPTCSAGCARAWPPLIVDFPVIAPDGVDPASLRTVKHPDGGTQVEIGKWPLYRFASDERPGDTSGQGSGGRWFVVGADGNPIENQP